MPTKLSLKQIEDIDDWLPLQKLFNKLIYTLK